MRILDFLSGKNKGNGERQTDQQLLEKVEMVPGISIPRAFVPYWPDIGKTKLPCISITATPDDDLALEQSKFGHYPCMPLDLEYPKDAEGRWMYPLAQINCREIPALDGYPRSGYLQFFITAFDDAFGLDFKNEQSQANFRVIYFEDHEVEKYKADFSFLEEAMKSDRVPVYQPHGLSFSLKEEYIGLEDVRYEDKSHINLFTIAEKYPSIEDDLRKACYEVFQSTGHKMGGYSYFTQEDPRKYKKQFRDYILLLQIDSGDKIMWGDVGVANFFIHPDDLRKKDFSKVMYNWDCC